MGVVETARPRRRKRIPAVALLTERRPLAATDRRATKSGDTVVAPQATGLRAVPRLVQILGVAARHKLLPMLMGSGRRPRPKELREAFEELGLVFLKFGQVLAMRRDLLPAGYAEELESLHDELPAMGIDIVRTTIER
ncbi:MAG: hypothetical protein ACRC2B_11145, partial [Rubrivivax sp.]